MDRQVSKWVNGFVGVQADRRKGGWAYGQAGDAQVVG